MNYTESPVVFDCAGDRLVGVIATPLEQSCDTGVLIVVGGPQYRAGSHRQFTLLARDLAQAGIVSLRFDYRGIGDSEGDPRTFETIDVDIAAAIDAFFSHHAILHSIAIWGLCDAASAALIYAHQDSRVTGLILLNPWVHTQQLLAQTRLKHYYLSRLLEPSLWRKFFSGQFQVGASVSGFLDTVRAMHSQNRSTRKLFSWISSSRQAKQTECVESAPLGFLSSMLLGLSQFENGTLFVLSGNDLTASEFIQLAENHPGWRKAIRSPQIIRQTIPGANHTFSSRAWRNAVSVITINYLLNRGA